MLCEHVPEMFNSVKCFADENFGAVPTATSALPILTIPYWGQNVPS